MLMALGYPEIDLLTNSPDKVTQLGDQGITVRQVLPTGVFLTEHNVSYLYAKATITSHTIDLRKPA
jgi:GTP cyclohydrolase II